MRLHKRMPDIIHESLFEALHIRSVKMFDLAVETGDWLAEYVEREAEGISQMPYKPAGEVYWDEVLRTGEYVEVEVRNGWKYTEYGNKWDYRRLRVDCKHRIEFLLNFDFRWADLYRTWFQDYQL